MNKTKKLIHKKKSDSNKSLSDLYSSKENLKNESIQKRIYINIIHYKEYSEKYSSIEIEIKPVEKKYG